MTKDSRRSNLVLFEENGSENTTECLEIVGERIKDLDLDHVVIASTTGETGAKAVDFFENYDVNLAVVTHQYGFRKDGEIKLEEEYREIIENSDFASLVITPDVLTRVPKIMRKDYEGSNYLDVIADTLRLFSEGMKVGVECTVQAADSGELPVCEEIAVIAGTGQGADTGIILESQHSHKLMDIDIKEIICMPREK